MPARILAVLLTTIALLAGTLACGGDDKPKPPPPPPAAAVAPTFAGIESLGNDPADGTVLVIRWRPGTDDYTPADQLTYELRLWKDDPRRAVGEAPPPSDTIALVASGTCNPCVYRRNTPANGDVQWFVLTATDKDSQYDPAGAGGAGGTGGAMDHVAGADVYVPGAARVDAPIFEDVWSQSGTSAAVGAKVTLAGHFFLDEPTAEGVLTLNGVAIPDASIELWSDAAIRFTVPAGATTGPVEITTLFGSVSSPEPLTVTP